jgi:hypothetical protein
MVLWILPQSVLDLGSRTVYLKDIRYPNQLKSVKIL